jgi:hypothetical protein
MIDFSIGKLFRQQLFAGMPQTVSDYMAIA